MLRAEEVDVFALSAAVDTEISGVLSRPKFAAAIPLQRRNRFLRTLRQSAIWFDPAIRVTDCRDPKDDKYLELAPAAGAEILVSSDEDLLMLAPGAACASCDPPNTSLSFSSIEQAGILAAFGAFLPASAPQR